MNALAVKTLIAEEANLANFIFKEGSLLSIAGTTFAGEEIVYGEYTEYNFANTTTQPAVDSASWTPLPSGTLRWVRYKKEYSIMDCKTNRYISRTMDNAIFDSPRGSNVVLILLPQIDFGQKQKKALEITDSLFLLIMVPPLSGGYDFIPNAMIDGVNGIIKGEKVIASNIRNKIYNASSFVPSQIEGLLAEGKSVNFSTSGVFE